MKISRNWLKSLLPALEEISAENLEELLTLHTAEAEEILWPKKRFTNIFAAKLTAVRPHKTKDALSVGVFDLGNKQKQIVFGTAANLETGKIYALALPGAFAAGKQIQKSDLAGEKSEGMVCRNDELGMKNQDFFSFPEHCLGKEMLDICPNTSDAIIDIDNKSLTHRPDLMGHIGFARDLGAVLGKKFIPKTPSSKSPIEIVDSKKGVVEVLIETPHCRRFMAAKVQNVSLGHVSICKRIMLENLGTRSISDIVDITNLVLLLWGQPMHAFDADKIRGKIIVRQAKKGETLLALDEQEYELQETDIVIADEEKILSIAGVMGGLESSVTKETKDIIFESANFDPTFIRKTSQRLNLRSESSMRFEKSLDPENTKNGLLAALAFLEETQKNAKIEPKITDVYPQKNSVGKKILFSPELVRTKGGIELSDKKIREILEHLGFGVNETFEVAVPSFRATKDITIAEDLLEEVLRIYGIENIPPKLPNLPIKAPTKNQARTFERKVIRFLAAKGLQEVQHSSFIGANDIISKNPLEVENPSNQEATKLRTTLLSNFLRTLEAEILSEKSVSFFELGKVYKNDLSESNQLGILYAESKGNSERLFFESKSLLENLCKSLGKQLVLSFALPQKVSENQHPVRSAQILLNNQVIGQGGVVHPQKVSSKNTVAVFWEIDFDAFFQTFENADEILYQKPSEFPALVRDISIIVPEKTLVANIVLTAKNAAKNLQTMDLFDEFQDEAKLGKSKKNLAFHLLFQSKEKTLTSEAVDDEFQIIVQSLVEKFGATLRL